MKTYNPLPFQTKSSSLLAIVGLLAGAWQGISFADLDLRAPEWLLHHRALLTHGCIVPGLLVLLFWHTRKHAAGEFVRGAAIGFCMTNAAHLSFDLFPRAWWGHALIHLFAWAFSPALSWMWIASSILLCIYLARCVLRTIWELGISLAGIAVGFEKYAHEGLLWPILTIIIAGFLAFVLPVPRRYQHPTA